MFGSFYIQVLSPCLSKGMAVAAVVAVVCDCKLLCCMQWTAGCRERSTCVSMCVSGYKNRYSYSYSYSYRFV